MNKSKQINSMVILFLETQFKNKEYDLKKHYIDHIEYWSGNNIFFTYNFHIDKFRTSMQLDMIIERYIPDYKGFDDRIMILISEWCKENLPKYE